MDTNGLVVDSRQSGSARVLHHQRAEWEGAARAPREPRGGGEGGRPLPHHVPHQAQTPPTLVLR